MCDCPPYAKSSISLASFFTKQLNSHPSFIARCLKSSVSYFLIQPAPLCPMAFHRIYEEDNGECPQPPK